MKLKGEIQITLATCEKIELAHGLPKEHFDSTYYDGSSIIGIFQ